LKKSAKKVDRFFYCGIVVPQYDKQGKNEMNNMLRLSEATSLALHSMCLMALNNGEMLQTKSIAERLNCSVDHLSKVMQRLRKNHLIESTRGPKGGSRLLKDPSETSLLDIYEVIEGPFKLPHCMLDQPICGGHCLLFGDLLKEFDEKLRKHLKETTLAKASEVIKL
jgi:Rrf2 family protein